MDKQESPKKMKVMNEKTVQYATLSLAVIAVLLLVYMVAFAPSAQQQLSPTTPTPMVTQTPAACPQATPTHSVDEAKRYLARVMASYSDMAYAEVPTPQFNPYNGEWEANITISRNNTIQRVFIRIIDSPALQLDKAYLEGPKPLVISDNWVVTNGTIRIAGKIPCVLEAGCGNKTCVWEFADPYDRYSISAEEKMNAFLARHNGSVEFTYRILLTQSALLENNYGKEEVERISKYFICAQDQGLLAPLKKCALDKYKTKGVDAPLTKSELDACLPEGLDMEKFERCVSTAYVRIASDKTLAETYLGVSGLTTPSVVFGCQYRVHPTYLEHGFCAIYPDGNCTTR